MQAEKKRNDKDKARVEAVLQLARQYKAESEANLLKTR